MNVNWKIAFRKFRKNKFYSLINLSGLTLGILMCLLIVLFLQHESSYDQFHKDGDRIYQVALTSSFGGSEFYTSNTPPPVGETMVSEFPEIESYTRHHMPGDVAMRYEDQLFTESNVWMVDSNFLEFFSFTLLEGNPKTCLNDKNSMVLTASMAKKYFGGETALGKTLMMEDQPFKVTAVLEDLPRESSLQFEILAPIAASGAVNRFSWSWVWLQVDHYVRLHKPMDAAGLASLESKFPGMVLQHAVKAFRRVGYDLENFFAEGNRWELSLVPLADVHLNTPEMNSRLTTKGNIRDLYVFGTIGLFILLLACINFINLSTARSMQRAKEVGLRKVLGSMRSTLIRQFLSEAILYSLLATLTALALLQVSLPAFNYLMNLELVFSDVLYPWSLTAIILLPLLAGTLAGSYPAFYLSKFQPVAVLKGSIGGRRRGEQWIRSSLVVFQFAISVGLVICTLVVVQQIQFSINGDLGMDKDNILVIRNAQYLGDKKKSFKGEMENMSEVRQVSLSTDVPAGNNVFGDFYVPQTKEENAAVIDDLTLFSYLVDEDFIPTLNIELAEGRNFDEARGLDSLAVIVNEATVRLLGWENPIGQRLMYPGGRRESYEVVGVMKDFHVQSLRESINPFALFHESSNSYTLDHSLLAVKIAAGESRQVLDKVKALWTRFVPDAPFGYSFFDEDLNSLYQSERRLSTMLSYFTGISIFIACLGLLGLIVFTTERRTKEIGIRKVLGASVVSIVGLLSRDFLKLVLLSLLIASPIAWYVMKDWLEDFAYPIEISWWIFALAGGAALLIALLTVSWQSMKAALANPIDALRNE
ncbi:MAG: ABC transporter permease [Bacteroidota bacterium]